MNKGVPTTTPAVSLPEVSHQISPTIPNVIPQKLPKKSKGVGEEAVENREEEEEEEEKEEEAVAMDVDSESDDKTMMYTMKDDGTGTSSSKNPLPTALTPIEKITKKLFKGERAYTRFVLGGWESGNQQGPGSHPESADYEENTSDTSQIER